MKKVLFATTALLLSAGIASAQGVEVSGDGRMGVTYDDSAANQFAFSSRIRIKFTASGETDGGLSFGGSIRADNSGGGTAGTSGSVYIRGAFGKLSMGDVDGGAKAAVGHVDGVGFTGLGDRNEITYVANAGTDPSAQYMYSFGQFTGYASLSNPGTGTTAYAAGVKYQGDLFGAAIGYEDNQAGTTHVVGGANVTFSGITAKAVFGIASGTIDGQQYAASASYSTGAIGVTAFFRDTTGIGGTQDFGAGGTYDLGGGASLAAGFVRDNTNTVNRGDFGIKMSF